MVVRTSNAHVPDVAVPSPHDVAPVVPHAVVADCTCDAVDHGDDYGDYGDYDDYDCGVCYVDADADAGAARQRTASSTISQHASPMSYSGTVQCTD